MLPPPALPEARGRELGAFQSEHIDAGEAVEAVAAARRARDLGAGGSMLTSLPQTTSARHVKPRCTLRIVHGNARRQRRPGTCCLNKGLASSPKQYVNCSTLTFVEKITVTVFQGSQHSVPVHLHHVHARLETGHSDGAGRRKS